MKIGDNINVGKKGIAFTDKHDNQIGLSLVVNKIFNRLSNYLLDIELFILHLVSLHIPFYAVRMAFYKMFGVKVGKGSTIHMGVKFFYPKGVSIGDDTKVGDRTFLDGRDKLVIGNHVDIASEVMIYNSEHDINDEYFRAVVAPVSIGDYVFIGPRAIILPGVNIGKGAVVAAGAVVTKNIDNFSIVAGVPAKPIGKRNNINPHYKLGRSRILQ